MANFTVRVELHGANYPADYNGLHTAMENAGFSRTIKREDTPRCHLPSAEYSEVGDYTSEQILTLAKTAAATVWKNFSVLVTKSDEPRIWYNLTPVR